MYNDFITRVWGFTSRTYCWLSVGCCDEREYSVVFVYLFVIEGAASSLSVDTAAGGLDDTSSLR